MVSGGGAQCFTWLRVHTSSFLGWEQSPCWHGLLEKPFSAMANSEGAAEDIYGVGPATLSLQQNLSTSL